MAAPAPGSLSIALDIEGVLADSHVMISQLIKEKYGIDPDPAYAYQWGAEKGLLHMYDIEMSSKDYLWLFTEAWRRGDQIPRLDLGAEAFIAGVERLGHRVTIVTHSLNEETHTNKIAWVRKHITDRHEIVCVPDGGWKHQMNYDAFIDDCPHHPVGAKAHGKIGVLYDQPWNWGVQPHLVSARVKNLGEALEFFARQVDSAP